MLDEVGLVVSVGVATNKLCAKVASDLRKPDALVVVAPGEEAAFLAPLPIRRLWGVGPKAQKALGDYGVITIGQLAAMDRRPCNDDSDATASTSRPAHEASTADGSRRCQAPKSVGHEHTFGVDSADAGRLEATLLDLAESVASRLRRHDLAAGAVQLKLRYEGFETLTRQAPLPYQTRETAPLFDTAIALLQRTLVAGRGVRADRPHRHLADRRAAAHPVRRPGTQGSDCPLDRRRPRAFRRRRHHAGAAADRSARTAGSTSASGRRSRSISLTKRLDGSNICSV